MASDGEQDAGGHVAKRVVRGRRGPASQAIGQGVIVLLVCLVGLLLAIGGGLSWWPAEGSADDLVGNNPGALQGSATFAPDAIGQAFAFPDSDAAIRLPRETLNGTAESTFALWVKTVDTRAAVLSAANNREPDEVLLLISSAGSIDLYIGGASFTVSAPGIADDTLRHLAWVRRPDGV